jgi:hypothetical protein
MIASTVERFLSATIPVLVVLGTDP